jgi:phosphoribosylformylglycinamidine synthase
MTRFRARVSVRKKKTVADPEGKTISSALTRLGFDTVEKVRTGKVFTVDFSSEDEGAARELIERVSGDILSNPIIEVFDFEIEEI